MYRESFIILYYDQQMHNYLTSYHTPTCFDTIMSSSGSLYSIPCQVTQVPYILESNPHPFYSLRGLKNQMRIRFAVESRILEK